MVLRRAARKYCFLVLIFSTLLCAACDPATTANGNVRDQSGKPLEGVTVTMESDANQGAAFKKESEQRTSADGKFNFVTITGGAKQVRLTFTKEGYKTKQADIRADKENVSDIVLEPDIK